MNPSAAREETSDRTINRVINASVKLGHDGWVAFNTYPERATDAKDMDRIDYDMIKENVKQIESYLLAHNVKEVWGAWGNLKYEALKVGKDAILEMLNRHGIKVFYFGELTKSGNPRHPLYMASDLIGNDKKNYLN
jgi:hypothetical protein